MSKQTRPLARVPATKSTPPDPTTVVSTPAQRPLGTKPLRDAATQASDSRAKDPWVEVANFVLTFERRESGDGGRARRRITAHKMQDGGITEEWIGTAQAPMCDWIADHVDDWATVAPDDPYSLTGDNPERAEATVSPGDATPLALAVSRVRAVEAAQETASATAPSPNQDQRDGCRGRTTFEGGEAFDLEAWVEIDGMLLSDSSRRPPCSVQFFSRNTATKQGTRLGEATIATPAEGTSSYRAVLSQVHLPVGTYRLQSVATLRGAQFKLAYGEGPLLQVL